MVAEKGDFFKTLERIAHSKILLLHFRKSAWPETSSKDHAQPFSYQGRLWAHNGTIRDYKTLLKDVPGHDQLSQALDSEVYFRYIMSLASLGLEKAIRKAAQHLRKYDTYSSLTCLFSDGKRLYGYREYSRHPQYYSLYYASLGDASILSSEPISPRGQWRMIGKGKLIVL